MKTLSPDKSSGFPFLDFFAGSGLVTEALKPFFTAAWANDICGKKASVYRANHAGAPFHPGPIESVKGADIPAAALSWASFPCQDLSLAGGMKGINSARSGLVWEWLRVMDEAPFRPPIVVAENVTGLVSSNGGEGYRKLHRALVKRGYRAGAVVLDAIRWVPQSRPRVFVIGVDKEIDAGGLEDKNPGWAIPPSIIRAASNLKGWIWWRVPEPDARAVSLEDVVDFSAPLEPPDVTKRNLALIPPRHRERMEKEIKSGARVFPGYRRTREGKQTLELRFDGAAGCLRTPEGGSSRQLLVITRVKSLGVRLLTIKEAAALMGAEGYKLPGSYNDAYKAIGDAVAIPPARHLASSLLAPLAERAGAGAKIRSEAGACCQ